MKYSVDFNILITSSYDECCINIYSVPDFIIKECVSVGYEITRISILYDNKLN